MFTKRGLNVILFERVYKIREYQRIIIVFLLWDLDATGSRTIIEVASIHKMHATFSQSACGVCRSDKLLKCDCLRTSISHYT